MILGLTLLDFRHLSAIIKTLRWTQSQEHCFCYCSITSISYSLGKITFWGNCPWGESGMPIRDPAPYNHSPGDSLRFGALSIDLNTLVT